jgi:hypothetical protein
MNWIARRRLVVSPAPTTVAHRARAAAAMALAKALGAPALKSPPKWFNAMNREWRISWLISYPLFSRVRLRPRWMAEPWRQVAQVSNFRSHEQPNLPEGPTKTFPAPSQSSPAKIWGPPTATEHRFPLAARQLLPLGLIFCSQPSAWRGGGVAASIYSQRGSLGQATTSRNARSAGDREDRAEHAASVAVDPVVSVAIGRRWCWPHGAHAPYTPEKKKRPWEWWAGWA